MTVDELVVKVTGDTSSAKTAFDEIGGKIGELVVGMEAFQAVIDGLKFDSMREEFSVTFQALTGSIKGATSALESMKGLSEGSIFSEKDIGAALQKMVAMGSSVSDATDNLKMMADVASGLGVPLESISQKFAMIQDRGSATLRDLTSWQREGIPIFTALANAMGTSVDQIKLLANEGKIGLPQVEAAFQQLTSSTGQFYNLAEQKTQTLAGSFNQLQKAGEEYLGAMTSGLMGPLTDAFTEIAKAIRDITDKSTGFGNVFGGVVSILGNIIKSFIESLNTIPGILSLCAIGAVALNAAFGPIGIVVGALVIGIGAIKSALDGMHTAQLAADFGAIAEKENLAGKSMQEMEERLQKLSDYVKSTLNPQIEYNAGYVRDVATAWGVSCTTVEKLVLMHRDQLSPALAKIYEQQLAADTARSKGYTAYYDELKKEQAALDQQKATKAALQAAQVVTNAQEGIYSKLVSLGTMTQAEAFDELIKAREKDIDTIENAALTSGVMTEKQRADIASLQAQIETYNSKKLDLDIDYTAKSYKTYEDFYYQIDEARKQSLIQEAQQTQDAQTANYYAIEDLYIAPSIAAYQKLAAQPAIPDVDLKELGKSLEDSSSIFSSFSNIATQTFSTVKDQAKAFTNTFATTMGDLGKAVATGFADPMADIKLVMDVFSLAMESDKADADKMNDAFSTLSTTLMKALAPILKPILEIFTALVQVLTPIIKLIGDLLSVIAPLGEALSVVVGWIGDFVGGIAKLIDTGWNDLIDGIKGLFGIKDNTTTDTVNGLSKAFTDLTLTEMKELERLKTQSDFLSFNESFVNIGSDLTKSLIDGMEKGLGFQDFMASMKEYIKNLAIESAIYTAGIGGLLSDIGATIANDIANGLLTPDALADIKARLAAAVLKAQTISGTVNDLFQGFASGTDFAPGGMAIVGEQGPELVSLPRGSKVYNSSQTSDMMNASGGQVVNITINSPKAVDPAEAAKLLTQTMRQMNFQAALT